MSTVTLSTRVYDDSQLTLVGKFLKSMLKGLKVEMEISGTSSRGQVQIEVSGEDEEAALRYLDVKMGLCPMLLKNLRRFSVVRGRITAFNQDELYVDIGVFTPGILDATISLRHLQAQLVNGRKMPLEKMAKLFGLVPNVPLWVKVLSISEENQQVEIMLSERQLGLYRSWVESLLDRLAVLGAPFNEVAQALKRTKCNRDVLEIESLGFFEQAVVCKLGTKALGLIPKIGRKLWKANFSVFDPAGILQLLGHYHGVQINPT